MRNPRFGVKRNCIRGSPLPERHPRGLAHLALAQQRGKWRSQCLLRSSARQPGARCPQEFLDRDSLCCQSSGHTWLLWEGSNGVELQPQTWLHGLSPQRCNHPRATPEPHQPCWPICPLRHSYGLGPRGPLPREQEPGHPGTQVSPPQARLDTSRKLPQNL